MSSIFFHASRSPSRPWRALALALALALGATLAGCGPDKPFCLDAATTNNYVCVTPTDAKPQSDASDAPDAPKEEAGPVVVGDDESADAGTPAP